MRVALTLVFAWLLQRIGFPVVHRLERWMVRASHGREGRGAAAREDARPDVPLTPSSRRSSPPARCCIVLEVFGWDIKPRCSSARPSSARRSASARSSSCAT